MTKRFCSNIYIKNLKNVKKSGLNLIHLWFQYKLSQTKLQLLLLFQETKFYKSIYLNPLTFIVSDEANILNQHTSRCSMIKFNKPITITFQLFNALMQKLNVIFPGRHINWNVKNSLMLFQTDMINVANFDW